MESVKRKLNHFLVKGFGKGEDTASSGKGHCLAPGH